MCNRHPSSSSIKVVKFLLLLLSIVAITSCQSDSSLNDPVKYTYQIAFYLGVGAASIAAIVISIFLITQFFNNLPKIIVTLVYGLVILTIFLISVSILLGSFITICYIIIYEFFWLHTEGFFYSLGGLILGGILSIGVFSLIYYLFYISLIGQFIKNLFSSLDKWESNINDIDDIYTFLLSLKKK